MKFLIVHGDVPTTRAVEQALREANYHLRTAFEGLDAIDRALDERPDGIILGCDLPGLGGLDVARALRALEPTARIPILFLANNAQEAADVSRAGLPLVNVLVSPVEPQRLVEQAQKLLHARLPAPEMRAVDPDRHLTAISDPVTGLYARHYMLHRLGYEAARSARYHTPLSCVLFGLPDWKGLVEELGRAAGDRVLIEVANVFRRSARVADVIGRAAEDQFLMIAPHTDERGAMLSAARLRRLICEYHYDLPAKHANIDLAVGLAGAPGPSLADNLALLGRAEAALSEALTGKEKIIAG